MAIIGIQTGKSNTEDAQEKGIYPLFDRSQIIKKSNKYLFDGEYVIVAGEGNFKPKYYNGKFDLHQRAYCLNSMNTEMINNKYLYYLVLKNYQTFNDYSVGSTVPSLRLSSFSWIEKTIFPSIEEQQKIIDIIEPNEKLFLKYSKCIRIENFQETKIDMKNLIDIIEPLEKLKNNLTEQLNKFKNYIKLICLKHTIKSKLVENCSFIKGNNINKSNNSNKSTLFLNVAAANGNFNKFCYEEPNVFPGDITLSLDGNIGLVNNNLCGFNGYLYKICSDKIPNWQIYYSLKHDINQKIMKKNEIGTTIKHSPNSKKELLLLEFKNESLLSKMFKLEINIKKQINLIDKQINNLINLLIK